jgi:hypothetical protein
MDYDCCFESPSPLQLEPLSVILWHCLTHGQVVSIPATAVIHDCVRVLSKFRIGLWLQKKAVPNYDAFSAVVLSYHGHSIVADSPADDGVDRQFLLPIELLLRANIS